MRTTLLGGTWFVPIVAGLLIASLVKSRKTARELGLLVTGLLIPIAIVVFVSSEASLITATPMRALATVDLEVDGLSAVLLPLVTSLSLAILVGLPRAEVDVSAVAGLLVVEGATLGVLVSANVLLLALFWTLSLVPMVVEAYRSGDASLKRAARLAAMLCVPPMLAAIAAAVVTAMVAHVPSPFDVRALADSRVTRPMARYLAPLLLVACTARLGIFPFHLWMPVALGRGRLAIMLPTVLSPLGSYAFVRLALGLFPVATRGWCDALMLMATVSTLYGAILALGQHDARRQLGYLWTSVAGFVLAGAATLDAEGLSGALVHDLALSTALTGLALIVRAVEARTGTADFRRLGGLVAHAPTMATTYFLLGAAAVGFPATITFVSGDLVVQGLIRTRPIVAVLLLTAMAINGVTLVRSFKRIFLGPPSRHLDERTVVHDLLPRERWISVLLVLALLAGGFVPTPLLAIRRQVETGTLGYQTVE